MPKNPGKAKEKGSRVVYAWMDWITRPEWEAIRSRTGGNVNAELLALGLPLLAQWRESTVCVNGKMVTLQPGQILTSQQALA